MTKHVIPDSEQIKAAYDGYVGTGRRKPCLKAYNDTVYGIVSTAVGIYGPEADLNFIDMRTVRRMDWLFSETDTRWFNGDISKWDISNVTSAIYMFCGSAFNGDISQWAPVNMSDMTGMFELSKFDNPSPNAWTCMPKLRRTKYMFSSSAFDSDISGFDMSGVTDAYGMFARSKFTGDRSPGIGGWKLRADMNAANMFMGGRFRGDLSDWPYALRHDALECDRHCI
jgi:hypothetical protein